VLRPPTLLVAFNWSHSKLKARVFEATSFRDEGGDRRMNNHCTNVPPRRVSNLIRRITVSKQRKMHWWPSDCARFLTLVEGFNTQVVTLWCFNIVSVRARALYKYP
jgi:hypothetical protein